MQWEVWSIPQKGKTSSYLSDEGGGNLHCAPEIPIKDYSSVIGVLAYFLSSSTGLHHSYFFSLYLVIFAGTDFFCFLEVE